MISAAGWISFIRPTICRPASPRRSGRGTGSSADGPAPPERSARGIGSGSGASSASQASRPATLQQPGRLAGVDAAAHGVAGCRGQQRLLDHRRSVPVAPPRSYSAAVREGRTIHTRMRPVPGRPRPAGRCRCRPPPAQGRPPSTTSGTSTIERDLAGVPAGLVTLLTTISTPLSAVPASMQRCRRAASGTDRDAPIATRRSRARWRSGDPVPGGVDASGRRNAANQRRRFRCLLQQWRR